MTKCASLLVLMCTCLLSVAARANDAPPSDASIAELFQLGHVEDTFHALKPQVDSMMRKTLEEAMDGKTLNDAQRAAYERGRERMAASVSAHYNWEAMREIYLRAYQTAFTQDELDGIIAFYRTPAGAAWVIKMPLLQQTLLRETQAWMRPIVQEFKIIAEDMRKEIDQAAAKKR